MIYAPTKFEVATSNGLGEDTITRNVTEASGCINSTSTDALEVLTNTIPIDLHLKMRQAQEVVRISVKHEEDHLKKDFQEWAANSHSYGRKPTVFQMLSDV